MKSSLRATSIEDLSALRQFLESTFEVGLDTPFLNPAVMSWKYWDRRDDWTGPRSYLLERNGAIAAHAGVWPMTFGTGSDAVRGIQMIDWAAAKESPGAGLALVQKLSAMFDFIYSIDGSEMTRKALPAFGFVEYAREWNGAVPLRPLQQIFTHQSRNWKLVPRLVRNSLWAASKNASRFKDWAVAEIRPQDISDHSYLTDVTDAKVSPRPPAFFEYLLRCPVERFSLYGILNGSESKGCFAIGILRGQAKVAGVWLRDSNSEGWAAAYFLARQVARRLKGAYELVAAGTGEGLSRAGAAQAGFRIMQGPPVYLLNKKKLSFSPEFQFQLAETDGLFLDVGTASYWT